jgi:hypothetical protein
MTELSSVSGHTQVLDVMTALSRLSNLQRAIVAGRDSMEFYLALRRRGFLRVGTPATCRIARGLCAVGLIAGADSADSAETALTEISRFLAANAAVAMLIYPGQDGSSRKVRDKLYQLGFRIEAGVRCHDGFCAFRLSSRFRRNGERGVTAMTMCTNPVNWLSV